MNLLKAEGIASGLNHALELALIRGWNIVDDLDESSTHKLEVRVTCFWIKQFS
jgi:hypothetical protein